MPYGILWGVGMAIGYSVLATIIFIITAGGAFRAQGVSLLGTIGAYFFGGIVGGAVFGLLLPITSTRAGSVFVGICTAFPAGFGMMVAIAGPPSGWGPDELPAIVCVSVLLGGIIGYRSWVDPATGSE